MFAFIVLLTALSVSAVAAYYSIVGLAAIFAASVVPVIVMGTVLEVGKLVAVTFLHDHWSRINFLLKTYLTVAVVVLMFITSMGIFGFLSKAHIEQTATAGDNTLKIERLESRIAREQRAITDAETVLSQLDGAVQTLMDYDRIRGKDGAIATREKQKEERESLASVISSSEQKIDVLLEEKLTLESEQNALEAEVGPLKYIAESVYGQADRNILEQAVRWVIVIIVAVFDPLAISLLLAWNSLREVGRTKREGWSEAFEAQADVVSESGEKVAESVKTPEPPRPGLFWDKRKQVWRKKGTGAPVKI